MRGVTVGGEVAEDKSGLTPGDDVENLRACGCAEHLRHDVRQQLGERKALARYEADGDGGIEVASGDVADGEGHGEQGEAEGQGDTGKTDAKTGVGGGQNSGTASAEDQPCGSQEFGEETFAEIHFPSCTC